MLYLWLFGKRAAGQQAQVMDAYSFFIPPGRFLEYNGGLTFAVTSWWLLVKIREIEWVINVAT